jgi:hypothetical protein
MEVFLKFTAESNAEGNLGNITLESIHCLTSDDAFNIVKKEYTPKMKDKLYFLPGVNIPRVKLKDFALNYYIKTVREVKDADVVFGSRLSNQKVLTRTWQTIIRTEDFKSCFEVIADKKILDDYTVEKVKTALEFYNQDTIITDDRSVSIISDMSLYKSYIISPGVMLSSNKKTTYVKTVEEDYLEEALYLDGKEVYDEAALLKHINGDDAIVIDKEVYNQLEAMLDSSDNDNHVLAMEIMANCKLDESLFYLLKLMGNYSNKLTDCKGVNHVNFKSLLSYLGIDKWRMNFSTDEKIRKLMEKNVLTVGMLNALARDEMSSTSHFYSNMFQIKTITVAAEINEYLNKHYEFKLLDNFVPKEELPEIKPVQDPDQGLTWM